MKLPTCEIATFDCNSIEIQYCALVNILSTILDKYTPAADYSYFRFYEQKPKN